MALPHLRCRGDRAGRRAGDAARPARLGLGEDLGRGGVFGQYRGFVDEFGAERVGRPRRSRRRPSWARRSAPRWSARAPDRRDAHLRLRALRHGRAGQPGREGPLHVRRTGRPPSWCASRTACGAPRRRSIRRSLEAWFAHLPGVVVVTPATPPTTPACWSRRSAATTRSSSIRRIFGPLGDVGEPIEPIPLGAARSATATPRRW